MWVLLRVVGGWGRERGWTFQSTSGPVLSWLILSPRQRNPAPPSPTSYYYYNYSTNYSLSLYVLWGVAGASNGAILIEITATTNSTATIKGKRQQQ